MIFPTLMILWLVHYCYPSNSSEGVKWQDKEQHLWQKKWWDLSVEEFINDWMWWQTSLPSLFSHLPKSFMMTPCILRVLWLPGSYGFRKLLMQINNKQMKEVIENITGHNFNKCWLLSLCSPVFIVLYTANRSKCFVFLTNISCYRKLTHFSTKSDISS